VRIVLDTNVLIDGFQDDYSTQAKLIDAVINGQITALVTPDIKLEYTKILRRLINDPEYKNRINKFLSQAKPVTPTPVQVTIDDPDDYKFLQAAAGGQADHLVTKDNHLLAVGEIGKTRILAPQESWTAYQEENDDEGSSDWQMFTKGLGIGLFIIASLIIPFRNLSAQAETSNTDLADKQNEIAELEKKIKELQSQNDTAQHEASLINAQVSRLQASLQKAQLELQNTQSDIAATKTEQANNEDSIESLQRQIEDTKSRLRYLVRELYARERQPLIKIFFTNLSMSQVLAERSAYHELQKNTSAVIKELKDKSEELEKRQSDLEQQAIDLVKLQQIQAAQQVDISTQKSEQENFLVSKKAEQANYQRLLADAKKAREEIEQDIFTIQSSGTKVEVKLNDAFAAASYASELTGVRAALILGVIKTESNLGQNVGSGQFPDNMLTSQHDAFLKITSDLGLDPYTAPISRGGGAMGPGQFMPNTWLWIEPRVASLMKKSKANPYELGDAIVATAIYLADRGGTDPNREREAVGRYISPNWQKFSWYIDRVLAVAAEYAKEGV